MRGLIGIATLLAGCGFSVATNPGGGGGGDDVSPIDAATVPDDVDGDGVKNDVDNCPTVANPMQFNEDGDAMGDECDPCPQLAGEADDADDDGDKIGNGCDPRPGAAGDVLAYWNGFHVPSSTLPAGMTMAHGSAARWSVANGYLVHARSGEDWGVPSVDVGSASHTVDATFEITASFNATTAAAAGVSADVAANGGNLFECQARRDNNQREMWRWSGGGGGESGWSELDAVVASTPNDTYRVTLRRAPSDLQCTTTRAGQASVGLTDSTDSARNTRAGLFARNVDVRFRYLAVYTSPP